MNAIAEGPMARTELPLPSLRQATLLARLLGELMLSSVQGTAALNLSAADRLLTHARLPRPPSFDHRSEQWRWTWRSFEVCATTADQILQLSRGHVERSSDGLWRMTERLLDELAQVPAAQLDAMREVFDTLRLAQQGYLEAARQAHDALVEQVCALMPPQQAQQP